MMLSALPRKIIRGLPYLAKEVRSQISDRTPFFVARPRVVHLWRNAPCNGRCTMCSYGFLKGEDRRALSDSPLTDERIPSLLKQIAELAGRGTMVSYIGGEPLLNPHCLDWLDQANALGLDFRFTTNGYRIDEKVAQRLVASNLFNLGISLESLDPTVNEQIRPIPNGTAKTVQAIELILAEKKRQHARLSLNIKCTLTQVNLEAVEAIVERWGRCEGVIVTPQMFEVLGGLPEETKQKLWISDLPRLEALVGRLKAKRAAGYHLNADDNALDDFVRLYRDDPERQSNMNQRLVVKERKTACNIGTDTLFIAHGEVRLCPHFPPIGSALTDPPTLADLWFSPAAREVRRQIHDCHAVCTQSCLRQSSLRHKIRTFLRL